MSTAERPAVLCVDDEPNVLEGLKLHLERRFRLVTATGGRDGLERIAREGPFAVVLSDMRMPEMTGAEFLSRVREVSPASVRMLLTGQTELESAVRAVNEGQIFRFLTKPCPAPLLIAAVTAGVEQHRLLTAEKDLLERTLLGSVQVLSEVLALANAEAFGRAGRIRTYALELAEARRLERRWELETAAVLSQLGSVTLDRETLVRANHGQALTPDEVAALSKVPEVSRTLLARIPRLEGVCQILAHITPHGPGVGEDSLRQAAAVLRLVIEFDWLETRGDSESVAFQQLRAGNKHDPELLAVFERLRRRTVGADTQRQVPLAALQPGMVLAEDVKTAAGVLFAARGYVITEAFVARIRNFKAAGIPGTIQCTVPSEAAPDGAAGERAA